MLVRTGSGPAELVAAALTDRGRRRPTNEDFVFMRPRLGLFLVADGVGGRRSGQMASQLAAYSVNDFFSATRARPWPEPYEAMRDPRLPAALQRLAAAIRKANRDVATAATRRPEHQKMSTTLVAAHLEHTRGLVHVGHVGDSRCYLRRGGRLERLTSDHTLRNRARRARLGLRQRELARIPEHVLTEALGASRRVRMDLITLPLQVGDDLLLCSDGLYRMLDETRIVEALDLRADPHAAAELLVSLANAQGGRDNISVVLLRLRRPMAGR